MNIFHRLLVIITLLLSSAASSFAASSDWQDLGGGKARLVAFKNPETNTLSGMVEVILYEGWKTYWLSPGSSGIPPEFDFSRSTNLIFEPVRFPIPEKITIPDAEFYGYKNAVAFTFEALATDYDTALNVDMLIGVCEEICIPATAQFSIAADAINSSDSRSSIAVSIANSRLPDMASDTFRLNSLSVEAGNLIGGVIAEELTGKVDIVLHSDLWTSDPISVNISEEGLGHFSLTLPKKLASISINDVNWTYTLLHRSGSKAKVEHAVEGEIAIVSSQ